MQGEIVEREGNLMNDERKEVDLEARGNRNGKEAEAGRVFDVTNDVIRKITFPLQ